VPYKDPAVRKAKQKEYSASHYRRNTEKRKAETKAVKNKTVEWLRNYKASVGCFACEESDPQCIDFHHVISAGKLNREDTTARWIRDRGWGPERILKEITETCVPLCCNCHRKVHAQHRLWVKEENEAGE
jgi:hypothetical protein